MPFQNVIGIDISNYLYNCSKALLPVQRKYCNKIVGDFAFALLEGVKIYRYLPRLKKSYRYGSSYR